MRNNARPAHNNFCRASLKGMVLPASGVFTVSLLFYFSWIWTGRAQTRYAPCDR